MVECHGHRRCGADVGFELHKVTCNPRQHTFARPLVRTLGLVLQALATQYGNRIGDARQRSRKISLLTILPGDCVCSYSTTLVTNVGPSGFCVLTYVFKAIEPCMVGFVFSSIFPS